MRARQSRGSSKSRPPARVRPQAPRLTFHLSEHFFGKLCEIDWGVGVLLCSSRQVCTKKAYEDILPRGLLGSPFPMMLLLRREAACPPGGRASSAGGRGCFRPNARAPLPTRGPAARPSLALLPDRKAPGFHAASRVPSCRLAPRVQRLRRRAQPSSAPPQPGPSGLHPETSSGALASAAAAPQQAVTEGGQLTAHPGPERALAWWEIFSEFRAAAASDRYAAALAPAWTGSSLTQSSASCFADFSAPLQLDEPGSKVDHTPAAPIGPGDYSNLEEAPPLTKTAFIGHYGARSVLGRSLARSVGRPGR